MAQAEERKVSIGNQVLFQTQAPEVLEPQVQVAETARKIEREEESQSISRKLRNLINKGKLNARFTEELKSVKMARAKIDASMYSNYRTNF